nr:sigma-70 family RNA polymerase sigma factor [uncultured Carboxylicivirga sp.]
MTQFETIYQMYYQGLLRAAQQMLSNREEAGDVVHEVFVSLYNRMQSHSAEINNVKSWLYRAVMNKCIDAGRSQKNIQSLEGVSVVTEDINIDDNNYQTKILQTALLSLNEKERMMVVLYSQGLSYKEIAETAEVNFTSVGKTLSRSLKKLETLLKHQKHELLG